MQSTFDPNYNNLDSVPRPLPTMQQAQSPDTLPFVLIVPGQAPFTSFNCDNDIYHMDLVNPGTVSNLCLSLTSPLPDNYALTLYFSQPPYTSMQYLGAISNNNCSEIFSTGFPLRQEITALQTIKICLKVQHFSELTDLVLATDGKEEYSKLVAQNLYNFMMSFNKDDLLQQNVKGDFLVVPNNFLERWVYKFDQKYEKDPNFILKTTIN